MQPRLKPSEVCSPPLPRQTTEIPEKHEGLLAALQIHVGWDDPPNDAKKRAPRTFMVHTPILRPPSQVAVSAGSFGQRAQRQASGLAMLRSSQMSPFVLQTSGRRKRKKHFDSKEKPPHTHARCPFGIPSANSVPLEILPPAPGSSCA